MRFCFCAFFDFAFIVVFIAICQSQTKIKLKSKQKTTDLERLGAKLLKSLKTTKTTQPTKSHKESKPKMENILLDIFIAFSIIAICIVIAPILANLTRIPIVVVEMFLGCFGVYFGVFSHSEAFEIMAKVGFLFLMFLCGTEVDLRGFSRLGKRFLKSVVVYFVVLYALTAIIVLVLELPNVFIAALPVMSLGMIMTLIKDYGKDKLWLEISLAVGVIGEVISIAILTLISGFYHYGNSLRLYENLAVLLVFMLGIVGIFWVFKMLFWWFPNFKLFLMPYDDLSNRDIRFVIMLFIVFVALVLFLDLEAVLGAFLAGTIVAIFFSYKHELVGKLNEIGFGFFVPLFFVYVGSTLDLRLILQNPSYVLEGVYIAIAMLILRLVAANMAFFRYFKSAKSTTLFALSHAMPLTFLVVTAKIADDWNAINKDMYYAFLIAAMIEGIAFSIVIKFLWNLWKKPRK